MKWFKLDVAYPMDWFGMTTDKKIERVVGAKASGSGAGFGMRDLEFYFETEAARDRAHDALMTAKPTLGFNITVAKDEYEEV